MPYIGHAPTNAGTFYVIDDLTMSSSTTYTLQVGGVSVTPRADNLLITLDGVVQHATDAYTVSGSTLTFASAPGSGVDFYGIIMGQSASHGQGSIGADELSVTGDGSANQILSSDADGTMTWKDGTLSTTSATGDIIYRNASGVLAKLSIGSAGQLLTVASGLPSWATDSEPYLPLAGGTMSGAINLGSQNVTNGGTITGTFVGGLTGNVTGNASGTALTVTQAAQSAITSVGTLTTLTVDDITLNGSTISDGGDFILDVGGYTELNNDNGGIVIFSDASVQFGVIEHASSDFVLRAGVQDKDMLFKGNDGGSTITALSLDMSEGGNATFAGTATATALHAKNTTTSGVAGVEVGTGSGDFKLTTYGSSYSTNGAFRQDGAAVDADDNLSGGLSIISRHGSSGEIRFYTDGYADGNKRLTIGNNGQSTFTGDIISEGDIQMANGRGIDFSATADSAATKSSETFDDYEEGSWEPEWFGSTGNFSSITHNGDTGGRYTKIGRMVYLNGCVRTDSFSGGSGYLLMRGLPFTSAARSNGDDADFIGSTLATGNWVSNNFPQKLYLGQNTTEVQSWYLLDHAGNSSLNDTGDIQSGLYNRMHFTLVYVAA